MFSPTGETSGKSKRRFEEEEQGSPIEPPSTPIKNIRINELADEEDRMHPSPFSRALTGLRSLLWPQYEPGEQIVEELRVDSPERTPTKKARRQFDEAAVRPPAAPGTGGFITSTPPPRPGIRKYGTTPGSRRLQERSTGDTAPRVQRRLDQYFGTVEEHHTPYKRTYSPKKHTTPKSKAQRKKRGQRNQQSVLQTLFSPLFTLVSGSREERSDEPFGIDIEHERVPRRSMERVSFDGMMPSTSSESESYYDDIEHVVDDQTPDTPVKDVPMEEEDEECADDDSFDPYIFIASLPSLLKVEKMQRPAPGPPIPSLSSKDTRISLVLDLDETLIHASTEPLGQADLILPVVFNGITYQVYVKKRPGFEQFLKHVSKRFEIILFTASQKVYAEKLLNMLDPKGIYIHQRLYRESCAVIAGNYLKDLTVLGRNLAKTVIVDNSPQAFALQISNGIPIVSWFDDMNDRELLNLIPFLDTLHGKKDVRPLVRDNFKVHELVSAAAKENAIDET